MAGRVVIPSPAQPPLAVVLTCGSSVCRRVFAPDPIAFATARLACPACGGWTFHAALVDAEGPDLDAATEALEASGVVQHGRCAEVVQSAVLDVLEAAGRVSRHV